MRDLTHPTPESERAIPNCCVSIGPVATRLRSIVESYERGAEMDGGFGYAADYSRMMEAEMVEAVLSFGLSPRLYNDILRGRVSSRWLDANHDWALAPEVGV